MRDLAKLTAKDFSDAMHKGWKGLRYGKYYFIGKAGTLNDTPRNAVACCAIGAMARTLKIDPDVVMCELNSRPIKNIIRASDVARNKRAAMKAVDAILLGAKP